jgi:hypothetical protein
LELSFERIFECLVLLTFSLQSTLLHDLNSILRLDGYPTIYWGDYTCSTSYQLHNSDNLTSRQLVDLAGSGLKTASHECTTSMDNLVANGIFLGGFATP